MQVAKHWRNREKRYQLITNGVAAQVPVAALNGYNGHHNGSTPAIAVKPAPVSTVIRGEVYSFSTVYDAPEGYERYVPYTVAIVKLDTGDLVTAQITDTSPAEINIGMPVEMVTRKLRTEGAEGMILYGYKFRPAVQPAA